ncbi:MAG: nucleoside-diphosphate kinase [Minisyncoccus archaeiphilus]|nr:MAG: nucleoside-diphosphate kinase [Candidatus Parcubacteria bacterium]
MFIVKYSFGLLKPDCISRNLENNIFFLIELNNLNIIAFKKVRLSDNEVEIIWPACKFESYYREMIDFSISEDSIVFIVKGEYAIERLNELVGHYNPEMAKIGTIRKKFGISCMRNIIHSVDSEEIFKKHAALFFGKDFVEKCMIKT